MNGLEPEYGYLVLHAYDLKKVFYGLGSGLRQNLDWSNFKYLPCLIPPLDEQNVIVRYLDHTNHRINCHISAKECLITLLEEQWQAVVHQAVTRGLDPDVPLKSSGVPWLGDVPVHWNVDRIKTHVVNVNEAAVPSNQDVFRVGLEHVESWTGRIKQTNSAMAFNGQGKRFRAGDILFGKLRPYLAKVTRPVKSGICVREPLSKTGLSGLQAAGRLQGPEVGPESAVAVESGVSQAL